MLAQQNSQITTCFDDGLTYWLTSSPSTPKTIHWAYCSWTSLMPYGAEICNSVSMTEFFKCIACVLNLKVT